MESPTNSAPWMPPSRELEPNGSSKGIPLLWIVVMFSAMTGFLMGFDLSIIAVVLIPIETEFKLCPGDAFTCFPRKLFVSIIGLGALFGCLAGGCVADYLGRRYTLALSDVCFILGSSFFFFGTTFTHILIGRVIIGIGVGIGFVVFSAYVAEVASPETRGRLLLCQEVAQCIGVLFTYMAARVLDKKYWKELLCSAAVVAMIQLAGIAILPESPRWLLMQNRQEEAFAIMERLKMDRKLLENFDHDPRQQVLSTPLRKLPQLLWEHKRQMGTACFVGIAQNVLCLNAVQYYSTDLFYLAQVCKPEQWGIGLGVVKLIGTTAAFMFVDRTGRRSLLLTGTASLFFVYLLLALAYIMSPIKAIDVAMGYCRSAAAEREISSTGLGGKHSILMVVSLFLVIFCWELSWAGLMYVVASEIVPSSIRGIGMGIVISCFWISHFLSQFFFETAFHFVTIPGTFVCLSGLALVILSVTYLIVPDMTGKSLEAIGKLMRNQRSEDSAPLINESDAPGSYQPSYGVASDMLRTFHSSNAPNGSATAEQNRNVQSF